MPECLFCSIVTGEIPAEWGMQGERAVAFRDINPQAPVHVLVIPREHYADMAALAAADAGLLDAVATMAHDVAVAEGVAGSGYRTVFNTGVAAGQTVWHVHAHVLGGRPLTCPHRAARQPAPC